MTERLCSLGSASYVDTLSNLAFLDGIDAWTAVEGIRSGALPGELLPLFYHELTHHWTLNSPVGRAVSIARISAVWAMFGGNSAPSGVSPGDYAKYLAAGTFVRAFSEGLAQYAEFDSAMGGARSETFVTYLLSWLYCLGDLSKNDVRQALNQRLGAARTGRMMVERKANALRQPFTVRNGGYLPGYLAVKRLASRLRAAGGPFDDTDFVLSYLKAFVFHDPVTVELSLTLDGMEFTERYFEHLANRFAMLAGKSDGELRRAGEKLDEFFEGWRASESLTGQLKALMLPGLFAEPGEHGRVELMLIERLQHLGADKEYKRSAADGPENVIERFYGAVTRQRRLFCVAASDVAGQDVLAARLTSGEAVVLLKGQGPEGYFLAHWNPERYADLNGVESMDVDMASRTRVDLSGMRLEVWVDPVRTRAFLCLHSGEAKRVGIHSLLGPCRWEELPDVMPRDDTIRLLDLLDHSLMNAKLQARQGAAATTLGEATAGLHEQVLRDVDAILARVAFPWEDGQKVADVLAAKGLGGLASYQPDALRGLALMSLADAAGVEVETARVSAGLAPPSIELGEKTIEDMAGLGWAVCESGRWTV